MHINAHVVTSLVCVTLQTEWPSNLTHFNQWPSFNVAPDLTKHPGFVTVDTHYFYQEPPHGDPILFGFSKFAYKYVVSNMSLSDMTNMLLDVANAFTKEELPKIDFSPIEKYIKFEFDYYAELSNIKTEIFTPGLFLSAGSRVQLFGLKMNFSLDVAVPLPRTVGFYKTFYKAPLKTLEQIGMNVSANVTLPFGLGGVTMVGVINAMKFHIEATQSITLGKLELYAMHFETKLDYAKPGAFMLAMSTKVDLGVFGELDVRGKINSTELSLRGDLDVNFFGLRFCGGLEAKVDRTKKCFVTIMTKKITVPCFYLQFQAFLNLGILGRATFSGRVENKGVRVKATLSNEDSGGISAAIKDAIKAILGQEVQEYTDSESAGKVQEFIGKLVDAAIPIGRVDFELDTISEPGKLSLEIEFTVLAGTPVAQKVVLSNIEIKPKGGGRRLSGGRIAGRDYTLVEAYEAEYRRLHPEYETEQKNSLRRLESTIDCTKDAKFSPKDLVDRIIDSFDLKTMAAKLGLCLSNFVSNQPAGGKCALDSQCQDSDKFPGGLFCPKVSKSYGIRCTGTCQKRLEPGRACNFKHHAACKSNHCICGTCSVMNKAQVTLGKRCSRNQDCYFGWCTGSATGCLGTCTGFLKTAAQCLGNFLTTTSKNDDKCDGDRICSCGKCSFPERGKKSLSIGDLCRENQQCKGSFCDYQKTSIAGCSGKCRAFFETGEFCGGSNTEKLSGQHDYSCSGSRDCICDYCTKPNKKHDIGRNCRIDDNCDKSTSFCDAPPRALRCSGKCKKFLSEGDKCSRNNECVGSTECICNSCADKNRKVDIGRSCRIDENCKDGYCDGEGSTGCPGTCKKFLPVGAQCSRHGECVYDCICGVCANEKRQLEPGKKCRLDGNCNGYCDGATTVSLGCPGTCKRYLSEGEKCSENSECEGSRECICDICANLSRKHPHGKPCRVDDNCHDGYCVGGGSLKFGCPGSCNPLKNLNSQCSQNRECKSGRCQKCVEKRWGFGCKKKVCN